MTAARPTDDARGDPAPIATAAEEDRALAARAAAGDGAAFEAIYARHADAVYARLTRLLGPRPEREDVLQQAFLQVHRALGSFRGDASLATFVHRIALHAAYDHLRQRVRQPAAVELDDTTDAAAPQPSPARVAADREELTQIFAHLNQLTPDKRVAFVLIAVEGLSLREASDLLGASPDAVKQRALQARRDLLALIARAQRPRSPR